ncbi:uncharacterized protein [Penaeus vannamei]|uniref:uncharacterized protein n=1 Tax=Penaeus vannamei TaxID=6689 RepID=UPI00387F3F53
MEFLQERHLICRKFLKLPQVFSRRMKRMPDDSVNLLIVVGHLNFTVCQTNLLDCDEKHQVWYMISFLRCSGWCTSIILEIPIMHIHMR